jgi:hypothetical protein
MTVDDTTILESAGGHRPPLQNPEIDHSLDLKDHVARRHELQPREIDHEKSLAVCGATLYLGRAGVCPNDGGTDQRRQERRKPMIGIRGGGHPPTPATPPCVQVRTRRFETFGLTPFEQRRKTAIAEIGIRKRDIQSFRMGEMPRAMPAGGSIVRQLTTHTQLNPSARMTPEQAMNSRRGRGQDTLRPHWPWSRSVPIQFASRCRRKSVPQEPLVEPATKDRDSSKSFE